jgi:hypothetical protein
MAEPTPSRSPIDLLCLLGPTPQVVNELQARGIRCFATTTEREATETTHPDGTIARSSVFEFVQWREYPCPGPTPAPARMEGSE